MTGKWAMVVAIGMSVIGCGRKDDAVAPPATPATTSPTTIPTTAPASVLSIDGVPTAFPPNRVKLDDGASLVTVQMYTDEAALQVDSTANTVLLVLPVEVDGIADLPSATCHITGQVTDADSDSPNGLFLNGGATQLTPLDVNVTFSGDANVLTATIDGMFVSMAADAKQREVRVKGSLSAVVEKGERQDAKDAK